MACTIMCLFKPWTLENIYVRELCKLRSGFSCQALNLSLSDQYWRTFQQMRSKFQSAKTSPTYSARSKSLSRNFKLWQNLQVTRRTVKLSGNLFILIGRTVLTHWEEIWRWVGLLRSFWRDKRSQKCSQARPEPFACKAVDEEVERAVERDLVSFSCSE